MFALSVRPRRFEVAIKGVAALLVDFGHPGEGGWSIRRGECPGQVEALLGRVGVVLWTGKDIQALTVG